jgi:tetratricopeptide (TPR) repeat protein
MAKKKSRQSRPALRTSRGRRWARHELYGDIPLIHHSSIGPDGESHERWQYDPSFMPVLPRGAVAGDVSQQVFYEWHVPKYFYVDEARRCVQCDEQFTFSAKEQKYWYEVRKFNFRSTPIRCSKCRRLKRSEHALRQQIAHSRQAIEELPRDPSAYLALARAIVEYHERTSAGSLDDALAAARKARTLWPETPEPDLWEGIAQARAGRRKQARECLSRFIKRASPRFSHLESKARPYLADGVS